MKRLISVFASLTTLTLGITLTGCVTHSPVRTVHVVKHQPVNYYHTGYKPHSTYSAYPSFSTHGSYKSINVYTRYDSHNPKKDYPTEHYKHKINKPKNPYQPVQYEQKRGKTEKVIRIVKKNPPIVANNTNPSKPIKVGERDSKNHHSRYHDNKQKGDKSDNRREKDNNRERNYR
ncbi:hypothetical protein THMIRHAM_15430 [Thiomicrorhabdus immobilis]|uniref:Lipoprotein n=1 Tax=Thiomicrorhabdus immobilis TaxID=2791037 RepID=A0ABN6CX94_9GAMM|nr:hypothetical protein [Thiomicrorhabdus immobilis]BCN93758.1 hypothetical protein THMIRHAM_15430 [Thiomicrorhabdus immobilis]